MVNRFPFLTLLSLPGDAAIVVSCTLPLKLEIGDDGEEDVVLAGIAGKQTVYFRLADEVYSGEGLDNEVIRAGLFVLEE